MQTVLNLLTRDGVAYMEFRASLSAKQYAFLLELSTLSQSRAEFTSCVTEWAKVEGLKVSFDPHYTRELMFSALESRRKLVVSTLDRNIDQPACGCSVAWTWQ